MGDGILRGRCICASSQLLIRKPFPQGRAYQLRKVILGPLLPATPIQFHDPFAFYFVLGLCFLCPTPELNAVQRDGEEGSSGSFVSRARETLV